jgi:hypothetical protein
MTDSITLKLPIEKISTELIDQIDSLCNGSKGPHRLRMEFLDHTHKTKLSFVARERKVTVDNEFTARLDALGIRFKLN